MREIKYVKSVFYLCVCMLVSFTLKTSCLPMRVFVTVSRNVLYTYNIRDISAKAHT